MTRDRALMGRFANRPLTTAAAGAVASAVTALSLVVWQALSP